MMRVISLFMMLMVVGTSLAFAQPSKCDAVLAKDAVIENYQNRVALAALSLVTEDNFQEFKKNFSGGLSFPFEGIPLKADTQWSEFNAARHSYLQKYSYNYDESTNRS